MCGIAGIFRYEGLPRGEDAIRIMTEALQHRGPDEEGYFRDDFVCLGFRRLSIVDVAGGQQPIYNEDRSLVCICNGEIYNYKELKADLMLKGHTFGSEVDVEVLVHLFEEYGTSCVKLLNGQFAFAIYDQAGKSLFIARDHAGIAPLFYTVRNDNRIIFASEIKAIVRHPGVARRVDVTGLDQIITFPGMISPRTAFQDISSVPPGHYLLVTNGETECVKYWDLAFPKEHEETLYPEEYYVEKLDELLQRSVRYRLNAEVPLGFYLSGGLDSSLIGSLIRHLSPGIETRSFSIAFENQEIDERIYQRRMSKTLESTHYEYVFKPDDIEKRLKQAVYCAETPLKETYNTCSLALSETVRRNNVKVILSGEGADELFAGYVGYKFDAMRHGHATEYSYEDNMDSEIRRKLWGDPSFIYERNYFTFNELKSGLYSGKLRDAFESFNCLNNSVINKDCLSGISRLHKRSYIDFKLRVCDHLVADHGDRVSYANSVETRYPFLDVNLIEFVSQIPGRLKLKDLSEKYILKKYSRKYLPGEIIDRQKFSFVAPGTHFLLRQDIEWVKDILSYETIRRQGYFDPDAVERLKKFYASDSFDINQTFETDLLMIVLTFGLFQEVFQMPSF